MTERPAFWWRLTAAYVVVLYATLPLGRPLVNWFRSVVSSPTAQFQCVFVICVVIAVVCVAWLVLQWRSLAPLAWVALLIIAGLYVLEFRAMAAQAESHGAYAEECLHFLEYGVLAWMLLTAFSFHCRGVWPYVFAGVLGAVLGWGDEGVQYLTQYIPAVASWCGGTIHPLTFRRYYALSDVWLNVKGVAYGLAFLALVVRNRRIMPTADR